MPSGMRLTPTRRSNSSPLPSCCPAELQSLIPYDYRPAARISIHLDACPLLSSRMRITVGLPHTSRRSTASQFLPRTSWQLSFGIFESLRVAPVLTGLSHYHSKEQLQANSHC